MNAEISPARPSRWLIVLQNPLSRIVLFVLMMVGFTVLLYKILPAGKLGSIGALLAVDPSKPVLWIYAVKSLVPTTLSYWLLVRLVERRRIDELAPRKLLPHFTVGWMVGTAILVLAALTMGLLGAYSIDGANSNVNWLTPLIVLGVLPGITEEIMFRGVLFRIFEDGMGTWLALLISAIFFGAVHLANPNATTWSSIAIALEAGLLLGMAYAWTRSLWFVMGLHAAWNFAQGVLLGIPVSGVAVRGFVASSTHGSLWLSGGEFGAEASVTTVLICTALAAFFTRKAIAQRRIRPPFWRRPEPRPAVAYAVTTEAAITPDLPKIEM